MNMFSLIAGQVRDRQELFEEEGKIMQALLNDGYRLHEADAALTLMQTLARKEAETFLEHRHGRAVSPLRFRTMSREERDRFTTDAFSFVIKLAHLGIISEDQREDLFEKAMNTYTGRIDLDLIKTLVAFVLFTNAPEHEHTSFSDLRRIKNSAWN